MSKKKKIPIPEDFIINAINTLPISELKPVARVVCGADSEIMYYDNPKQSSYYHKSELFRYALRRCYSIGAFDHRETIVRMLDLEAKYNNSKERK